MCRRGVRSGDARARPGPAAAPDRCGSRGRGSLGLSLASAACGCSGSGDRGRGRPAVDPVRSPGAPAAPRPGHALRRGARCDVVVGFGAISALGVLVQVDPVFTDPRILGTLLLGAGLLVAAAAEPAGQRRLLAGLGAVRLSLLPLWPLVYAVQWVPAGVAAGVFGLFGAGWLALAAGSPATPPPAGPSPRPLPAVPPSPPSA